MEGRGRRRTREEVGVGRGNEVGWEERGVACQGMRVKGEESLGARGKREGNKGEGSPAPSLRSQLQVPQVPGGGCMDTEERKRDDRGELEKGGDTEAEQEGGDEGGVRGAASGFPAT